MSSLRSLGYRISQTPPDPLLAMLERAQLRPRPLNRAFPRDGHWVARCPLCGGDDGIWVHPNQTEWSAACRRGKVFGLLELHAALMEPAA